MIKIKVVKRSWNDQPVEYARVDIKTTGFSGGFLEPMRTDDDGVCYCNETYGHDEGRVWVNNIDCGIHDLTRSVYIQLP